MVLPISYNRKHFRHGNKVGSHRNIISLACICLYLPGNRFIPRNIALTHFAHVRILKFGSHGIHFVSLLFICKEPRNSFFPSETRIVNRWKMRSFILVFHLWITFERKLLFSLDVQYCRIWTFWKITSEKFVLILPGSSNVMIKFVYKQKMSYNSCFNYQNHLWIFISLPTCTWRPAVSFQFVI